MTMLLHVIFTILSFVPIGLIVGWYYQYFKHNRYYLNYNGPTPIPIFGNIYRVASSLDIIPVIMDYHKKYGPLIRMWFGYNPRLVISDYKASELLLGSNTLIEKSYDYNFFKAWLGTGLLTSAETKWRRQRKLLTPTFHFQILEQYISIFNSQSEILIEMLRTGGINNKSFDIYPYINLCTLDVICEAAMGVQIHAQKGKARDYTDAVTVVTEIFLRRSFSPLKQFDFAFKFSRDYRKEQRALKILHGHTNAVIHSRQKELAEHVDCSESNENLLGIKKRMAFLDLLLQCKIDGKPLPLENVREEVDTFMFEGHDTTTAGVCFTLYCLSQNLDIQNKVVKELDDIFNNNKYKEPSYTELQSMKYLEMVIKESLRLYPPVPIISRYAPDNTEFGGNVFGKSLSMSLFIYGLHRQEEIFPDPETFDPERFSTENSLKKACFAYVPFSAGPRNCIGQRFAMLELKAIISKVLRNFEILPALGYKPILTPDAILRTTNGILLNLKERKF